MKIIDINKLNDKIFKCLEDLGLIKDVDNDIHKITKIELIVDVDEIPIVKVEYKVIDELKDN